MAVSGGSDVQIIPDNIDQHIKSITPEQWNQLFAFIPLIEQEKNFTEVIQSTDEEEGVISFPFVSNGKVISGLITTLYQLRLVPSFDWPTWKEWREIINQNTINNQDAVTITRIFTVMVRSERFCDGFVAGWARKGIVVELLKRLKETVS